MTSDHIVVIGASLAGLRTVQSLRQHGFDGRLSVVGAESHLPYDRPPLSKSFLTQDTEPSVELADTEGLAKLDVHFELGCSAVALDPVERTITVEGDERLAYDTAVIATGTTPRRLSTAEGIAGIHTLRTVDDARSIRSGLEANPRVVVVGAGFIGAEIASSIRKRGGDVTIVEALDQPLVRGLGPRLGQVVANWYRDRGVKLLLDTGVTGFTVTADRRVTAVEVSTGESIPADLVIVGIGVVPATDWLVGSGVTIDNGVVCDEFLAAVGVDGVWAVGDIARWPHAQRGELVRLEHWTSATETADRVATNILATAAGGSPTAHVPVPYVWSDQFDTKIQIAGHIGPGDEVEVVRGSTEVTPDADPRFVALAHRDGFVTGVVGFSEPRRVVMTQMAMRRGPVTLEEARVLAG